MLQSNYEQHQTEKQDKYECKCLRNLTGDRRYLSFHKNLQVIDYLTQASRSLQIHPPCEFFFESRNRARCSSSAPCRDGGQSWEHIGQRLKSRHFVINQRCHERGSTLSNRSRNGFSSAMPVVASSNRVWKSRLPHIDASMVKHSMSRSRSLFRFASSLPFSSTEPYEQASLSCRSNAILAPNLPVAAIESCPIARCSVTVRASENVRTACMYSGVFQHLQFHCEQRLENLRLVRGDTRPAHLNHGQR